jgi:hypothetical protein
MNLEMILDLAVDFSPPHKYKTMLEITTIQNLSPIELEVQELRKQYGGIIIDGVADKQGYRDADKARAAVRARRLELQKDGKAIEQRIAEIKKEFQGGLGIVLDDLELLEKEIKFKLELIDKESEKIKAAAKAEKEDAERKELESFNARVELLFESGFTYNGLQYTVGSIMVEPATVAQMSDENLAQIVAAGKSEFDRIQAILNPIQEKPIIEEFATEYDGVSGLVFGWAEDLAKAKKENEFDQAKYEEKQQLRYAEEAALIDAELPFGQVPVYPNGDQLITTTQIEPINVVNQFTRVLPDGYVLGFNSARNKVIELLNNSKPKRRGELIIEIQQLEY